MPGESDLDSPASATRAPTEERNYAKRMVLDKIRGSTNWITSSELKAYVERHCRWAEYGNKLARSRTIDNWLIELRREAEMNQEIEFYRLGKGYRYRSGRHDKLSLETANLVLLAERLLQPFLPREHIESGLQSLFQAADAKLREYEKKCGRNGEAVGALLERITVDQRGQRLGGADASSQIVPVVTEAILKRKCIEAEYQGCKRRLHPYGLLFRDPKFYLLAVDDQVLRDAGGRIDDLAPEKYQCSRFDHAEVSTVVNLVPPGFVLTSWMRENYKGVPIRDLGPLESGPMTLELRLFVNASSALVQDLRNHPISPTQRILSAGEKNGQTRLVAKDVWPTVELMNWLLARGQVVEVLGPEFLRRRVAGEVVAMAKRYQGVLPPDDRRVA